MANATWDEPAAAAPSVKRATTERQRIHSFKSLPSSPGKSSKRNTFKADKGIDRLLSLLRTPSYCAAQPMPEDPMVPRAIVCNIGLVKKKRTLDERIKKLSMSDSKTSMASSLSDCSLFTLAPTAGAADAPSNNKPDCDVLSQQPAKRLRKSLNKIENSELSRVQSCQTA